jgi:hypothetical protein
MVQNGWELDTSIFEYDVTHIQVICPHIGRIRQFSTILLT